jgi:hypothetical protein
VVQQTRKHVSNTNKNTQTRMHKLADSHLDVLRARLAPCCGTVNHRLIRCRTDNAGWDEFPTGPVLHVVADLSPSNHAACLLKLITRQHPLFSPSDTSLSYAVSLWLCIFCAVCPTAGAIH